MPDIHKVPQQFQQPIRIGASATDLAELLVGQVTIDLPSATAGLEVSASGAAAGLVLGQHKVMLQGASGDATNRMVINAAFVSAADATATPFIGVCAANVSAGTLDATAQLFNYLAWR